MLELNVGLEYSEMPPPNRATVTIRSTARSFKDTVKSLPQRVKGRRTADTEAGAGEEKTNKKVLEEYRQKLQNTFGNSESINLVMKDVGWWMDGL